MRTRILLSLLLLATLPFLLGADLQGGDGGLLERPPVLQFPPNGWTTDTLTPTLRWQAEGHVQVWVADMSVEVRDSGPGIPDTDKPHVFDRFYRAVHTRSMPGSGLGLAIVSQCAEDNDGETFVRDNPGGGAVVGIRFR